MNIKSWKVLPFDKAQATEITHTYDIPSIIAMVLQARGIVTDEKIRELIEQDTFAESPFDLIDMDKAVKRIHEAIENFDSIAIYGDYDADGITATSILYTYLDSMGANVMYYIPMREGEGYGLNGTAVESLAERDVRLIITVDNGISSFEEVEKATELGMDVIITDHHRPQENLPKAFAVVDPHRQDCPSKFKEYAGAGIALKLVSALEWGVSSPEDILESYADLAAIGTIGDVVPLMGENRVIVKKGLERLEESDREGILALIDEAKLTKITSTTVAFTLVPRINATGRMGAPKRAVELLITDHAEDAAVLAESICQDNEERREVEGQITKAAIEAIENNDEIKYSRVLVVDGNGWHPGVIGIVAAKIMERYGKPVVVLSVNADEAKGSGRSYEEFSLFNAVSACANTLIKFGGHHMAAGVTLKANKIPEFRKAINDYARKQIRYMPGFPVKIDLKIMPVALSLDIPENLAIFEPFGKGNPYPVFGLYNMELIELMPVGNGNHLRLKLKRQGVEVSCMRFGCKEEEFPFSVGETLDLAVVLDAKEFRGANTLTVIAREIKHAIPDMQAQLISYRKYEMYRVGEALTAKEAEDITPNRDEIAKVYRFINGAKGYAKSPMQMLTKLNDISLGKLLVCIDILAERKLIKASGDEIINISIEKTTEKTDIYQSEIFKKIKGLCS